MYHSPTHCWQALAWDVWDNPPNDNWILQSNSIDLSNSNNPSLSFWHRYVALNNRTRGRVEISTDGGNNWNMRDQFRNTSWNWSEEKIEIDLSAYAGEQNVMIRFNSSTRNSSYENWFIDDVKIHDPNSPTLMVCVKEAASVSFTGGDTQITAGDTFYQEDAGGDVTASATIYTAPMLSSGTWTGGAAKGDILLRDGSGNFQDGEDLLVGGEQSALPFRLAYS